MLNDVHIVIKPAGCSLHLLGRLRRRSKRASQARDKSGTITIELAMPAETDIELLVLRAVIGISALVFAAKLLGGLCSRYGIPEVIGEVTSGIILGPTALGGLIQIQIRDSTAPLIVHDELILAFAQIGGIIILFAAGLETTFAEFRAAGKPSFLVAAAGVIAPFFLGYYVTIELGYGWAVALLIGAALTATSIAVTIRVLEDMRQIHTEEARIVINAAVIDDVFALAVLAIAISVIQEGKIPDPVSIGIKTAEALLLWMGLLIGAVFVLPRFINIASLWRSEGTTEAAATASVFGLSALAFAFGLSPIVGAFAAGMAIASSKAIGRIKEYIAKLKLIFAPLFFAVVGTFLQIPAVLNLSSLVFAAILVVAVFSKTIGCGIPAALFLRDRDRGLRVGFGMVPRGEVGFIVAGLGRQLVGEDIYAALVAVIMATTILSPFLLKRAFTGPILKRKPPPRPK